MTATKKRLISYCEATHRDKEIELKVCTKSDGLQVRVELHGCWRDGGILSYTLYKPNKLNNQDAQDRARKIDEAVKKYQKWLDEWKEANPGHYVAPDLSDRPRIGDGFDDEPDEEPDQEDALAGEKLDRELTITYIQGKAASLEELGSKLQKKAGDHFSLREDTLANYLRDTLIPLVTGLAEERRREYLQHKKAFDHDFPDDE